MIEKKYDEEIELYRKATVADSTSARAHLDLASAFASNKQYDEAVEHYHRVIEIDLTQVDYSKLLEFLDNVSPDKITETLDTIEEALTNHGDLKQHLELWGCLC